MLLHGFSGSANGLYVVPGTFDALVAAGYHVVALDQIGHGESDKPHDANRYGLAMVADIERLIEHLGVDRIHLAGYSMGAKVANTFRSMHPNRLHSIVLGGYGWPWASQRVSYAEAEASLQQRTILPGNDLRALAAVSVGMHALTPKEEALRSNSVPALAIIGDKDEVVSEAYYRTLVQTMAGITARVIPGTHAGPDGAPYKPRYVQELIAFLDGIE